MKSTDEAVNNDIDDDIELPHKTLAELSSDAVEFDLNEMDLSSSIDLMYDWLNGQPIDPYLCGYVAMFLNHLAVRTGVTEIVHKPNFIEDVAKAKEKYEHQTYLSDIRYSDDYLEEWLEEPLQTGDTVFVATPIESADKLDFNIIETQILFADEDLFDIQIDIDDKPYSIKFSQDEKLAIGVDTPIRIYPDKDMAEHYIQRLILIDDVERKIMQGKSSYTKGLNKIGSGDLKHIANLLSDTDL